MQELLKFKMRYGRLYVLVRWAGLNATGYTRLNRAPAHDTWEPLDNLINCEAAIAAYEQATGRTLPRPALPSQSAGAAGAPAQIPPAGYTQCL